MQLTIPFFSKEDPKQYKEISKSIGYYCYDQHGINQRALEDKLCIIPVVAGTDKNLGFKLTEFVNFQFPLPPFSKEGIFSILKTKNISESWYNNKEKIRFWHSVGMIPRTLEFGITAIQNLNSNEIKSEEFLFSEVEKMIYLNYGKLETEFKKELLYFSFTGTSVEPFLGSNWYEKLYLEGIIYKDPNTDKLLLPYPYFNNVIEYQNSGIPSNLFPKLTSQYFWNLFEELIVYILYHSMKGSNEFEHKKKIFIDDLFKGAYISNNIKLEELNIENVKLIIENEDPFLKGTKENPQLNKWNKEDKRTIISKCKKNNLLVDTTITDEFNKIIILIQKKYTENPKNDGEDQLETGYPKLWFDQISKIENFAEFKDYKIIYVFFTNANIPKKANEVIQIGGNKVILEQSVLNYFFSLNIFPFVSSVVE